MKRVLEISLFIILYVFWLILCFFISLPGLFLPKIREKILISIVKDSVTICRLLVRKKKITKANYEFEATHVAHYYDENTFDGYMFVVKPVIISLENSRAIDDLVTFFVRRWIRVQKYKIVGAGSKPPRFHTALADICVFFAYGVGRTLNLFR